MTALAFTAQDPWTPYASQPLDQGKGHHPAAPEPASWGLLMVGFALALFAYIRFVRPRNRCGCGHPHP